MRLVVNMHNEGASPARSWLGSNRPGLARELGWECSWIGKLMDTMARGQVQNLTRTNRALAFCLAVMKTSAF